MKSFKKTLLVTLFGLMLCIGSASSRANEGLKLPEKSGSVDYQVRVFEKSTSEFKYYKETLYWNEFGKKFVRIKSIEDQTEERILEPFVPVNIELQHTSLAQKSGVGKECVEASNEDKTIGGCFWGDVPLVASFRYDKKTIDYMVERIKIWDVPNLYFNEDEYLEKKQEEAGFLEKWYKTGTDGCVRSMDTVDLALERRSPKEGVVPLDPLKFSIPLSYMINSANKKGGEQSSVQINADLDTLEPTCMRQFRSDINKKKIVYPRNDQNTVTINIRPSIPTAIANYNAHVKKTFSVFKSKDDLGFDIYQKDLQEKYVERYGPSDELLIPLEDKWNFKKPVYVECSITRNSPNFSDWNDIYNEQQSEYRRSVCRIDFMFKDSARLEVRFRHDNLARAEEIIEKVERLIGSFLIE